MKIKISEYIANFLAEKKINVCFMITGGGAMHLDDAIGHNKNIKCVFNHHEQASSIAAESFSRYSGKVASVCVTSGPGGINAMTGVMGAYVDSIPMFVLSGQVKNEMIVSHYKFLKIRQLGDQEYDIVSSVKNMTKYAKLVSNKKNIAYELEKAYYIATNGRKGPVWLDIPLDVQSSIVDTEELKHFRINKKNKTKKYNYKKILELIHKAKAPLILAGTGVRLSNGVENLNKLVEKLQIPVVTAWNANDCISFDNQYFVGMPGTVGTRAGNFSITNCDLLLSIGCRLNIRMIGYNKFEFAKQAKKIVVDIDKNEFKKPTVKIDMPINMDANEFILNLLHAEYKINPLHKSWLMWCKNNFKKYEVTNDKKSDKGFINPYIFLDKLFFNLNEKDRIVCGNGSACVMTFQACKIKKGQRIFTNSGCAAMGYALPASIGVNIEDNSYRTICIDGDGSFMMNLQELATIYHNKLNIKIFILNNDGYHSIRQTQQNLFNLPYIGIDESSGLSFPDFKTIADAFHFNYYCITDEKSADEIIKKAISGENPTICEVKVDKKQNFEPKTMSRKNEKGEIISTPIDDMYPFLDREEYNSIKYEK